MGEDGQACKRRVQAVPGTSASVVVLWLPKKPRLQIKAAVLMKLAHSLSLRLLSLRLHRVL